MNDTEAMSEPMYNDRLVSIYTVTRQAATAAARNTPGARSKATFEITAESEAEALRKAREASAYSASNFTWTVEGCRVVTIREALQ